MSSDPAIDEVRRFICDAASTSLGERIGDSAMCDAVGEPSLAHDGVDMAGKIRACLDELRRLADPTPDATQATLARRRARAQEFDEIAAVVDYGRRQRVVSYSLFDTLMVRDRGCRWAGCGLPVGSCDAHHATHWLDGGETEPDNLVLLCWFHHHLLHEQHWSIEPLGGGHFTLKNPSGDTQFLRPPMVGAALPTQPLLPMEAR